MAAQGWVEFRVQEDGVDVLVYQFGSMKEAAEIFDFIREFFPRGRFIIEPLRH